MDEKTGQENQALCPQCGQKGLKVKGVTLQSMLSLDQVSGDSFAGYRFCKTENCDIAYFGPEKRSFTKEQVKVPIFQKDPSDEVEVCYCFALSRGEVKKSVARGEGMKLYHEIKRRKDTEGCDCEVMNPQGNCCFGNVKQLILLQEQKLTIKG